MEVVLGVYSVSNHCTSQVRKLFPWIWIHLPSSSNGPQLKSVWLQALRPWDGCYFLQMIWSVIKALMLSPKLNVLWDFAGFPLWLLDLIALLWILILIIFLAV
jgi:hypothetical protein